MKHKWEPDTATISLCECGAKRRILSIKPKSAARSSSKSKPEYQAPGSTEWEPTVPVCSRAVTDHQRKR